MILGLLRFKILSPAHFKTVFSNSQSKSLGVTECLNDALGFEDKSDFVDVKKEVPFVGQLDDNTNLSKLAPNFQKLEELNEKILLVRRQLKETEKMKGKLYFSRTA